MRSITMRLTRLSPATLAIIGLLASPATSMQALAQAGVLEEVVVTARKREESMQETPVAVSALSGMQLEEAGLNDLLDLNKVVPNLSATVGSGGGATQLFIRGVGARNTGANFDGGVAIYVDGVYYSRPDGTIIDSVDVQSVQVLRGPQGTLFGKNSTGGAILYTTNKPTDVFEGYAEVRAGNYDRREGQLTVNVPLMEDALYSRASIYQTKREGLMEDQYGRDFSDINRYGGQVQLRALAGDSVTIDLNGGYHETDQKSQGQKCQIATGVPGSGWQAALQDQYIIVPSTGLTIAEHCQQSDDLSRWKLGEKRRGLGHHRLGNQRHAQFQEHQCLAQCGGRTAGRRVLHGDSDGAAPELRLLHRGTAGYRLVQPGIPAHRKRPGRFAELRGRPVRL